MTPVSSTLWTEIENDMGWGTLTHLEKSVAEAFVEARRQARVLTSYPGPRPQDLATAYLIQDQAIALDGRAIAGWKVGRIFPPDDARLGSDRIAGPIFADSIATGENHVPTMPVFAAGFAAVEAEFLLHVAPGHNGATPQDDAATRALLDDIRIGIEIASSPYAAINADGSAVTASDYGNNNGLVIGTELTDWRTCDLCAIPVETLIDGESVGRQTAATMLDGPLGAVRFLLGNLAQRGIDISAGTWVSTGAVTGVHMVRPGQSIAATFGAVQAVHCTIAAAIRR